MSVKAERVEIEVEREKAHAVLFLNDRKVTEATVVCAFGDWASGTEAICMALLGLVKWIRQTAPPQIVIRDPIIINQQKE